MDLECNFKWTKEQDNLINTVNPFWQFNAYSNLAKQLDL